MNFHYPLIILMVNPMRKLIKGDIREHIQMTTLVSPSSNIHHPPPKKMKNRAFRKRWSLQSEHHSQ